MKKKVKFVYQKHPSKKFAMEREARSHIEDDIRKKKFSIGATYPNPLTSDLHHAVTSLSAELYTKDVHFLMELLQNAEDNTYEEDVEPTLEFVMTTQDITGCGATETLLIFNNEVGFSRQNMDSICSVGRSTKKGKKDQGFIGEKGIGFKSVFLVSKQPHIISNGYKVKFNEEPDKSCGIGYIVPEWIPDLSFVSKIHDIYGLEDLPTTAIILPLKEDKVKSVKEELSSLHPELLLFLNKLKRLYVHADSAMSKSADSLTAISIVNETNHVVSRDKDADSRVVHLSVKDKPDGPEEKCQYYMWRQAFPVKEEARVASRNQVEKWIISLAFPFGNRLQRGTSSIGVFAFLPTSMVTNFPFVIQADFILASSRETIMFDNKWNRGILSCVFQAYVNAFRSCVKEGSPVFTAAQAFEFLPTKTSPFPELNMVRETIQKSLSNYTIIPCETFSYEMVFSKPSSTVRIHPFFRHILSMLKKSGVSLSNISSLKHLPVHSSLDDEKYNPSLEFLSVSSRDDWYEKCIAACDLVNQASDKLYIDLLLFVMQYVKYPDTISKFPLLKFSNELGEVELRSLAKSCDGTEIKYAVQSELHEWLHKCNRIFISPNKTFFLPYSVQVALTKHKYSRKVFNWLSLYGGVKPCTAFEYSVELGQYMSRAEVDPHTSINFVHFLYHSHQKNFLTDSEVSSVIRSMPMIDGSGILRVQRYQTLVPSAGSRWAKLLGESNPFVRMTYVDIGKVYDTTGDFAGEHTPEEVLLKFLTTHANARDLPDLRPPDMSLQVASCQLTSEQAFLLLDWIRFHKTMGFYIPENFTRSIRIGKWLKTTSGVDCPRNCTIPNETGKAILQIIRNGLAGFSILDENFYGERISLYTGELQFLGVRCGVNGVQEIVMDHFEQLSSSPMNRATAFTLFMFMGFLKARQLLENEWLDVMSAGRWLKTFKGYASPRESVFLQSDSIAEAAGIVTELHIIDSKYYGVKLSSFVDELKLLGIKFEADMFSLTPKNLSFPKTPSTLTSPHCGFLILDCLRNLGSQDTSFIERLQEYPWLKTTAGFKCCSDSVLYEPTWECLLNVAKVPLIDYEFYGNEVGSYKPELKALGVAVEFTDVMNIVVSELKTRLSSADPTHLIALLHCVSNMKETMRSELNYLCQLLRFEEILKTRHGFKRPNASILFNSKWASISQFVDLPLIDDCHYGISIYSLRDELKMLGVVSSLKDGATLVSIGLARPIDKELLTADGTLSLLFCLKEMMAADDGSRNNINPHIKPFIENLKKSELLKTSHGQFRLPEDCFYFDGHWRDMLDPLDAAFLDDKYYGEEMSDYVDQLKEIGVKFDPMEVCTALSQSLPHLDETLPIKRIYRFLKEFQWKPESQTDDSDNWKIWIPEKDASSIKGKWVDSSLCVVRDKAQHFSPILFSLDNYYEVELLPFFSSAFGVIGSPSMSHYLEIWKLWESKEDHAVSDTECCFFWSYILKNWNSDIGDTLKKNMVMVPTTSSPQGGFSLLVAKEQAFIPDDVWLKNIFTVGGADSPSFVWLPSTRMFSVVNPQKLSTVYDALGVRKLSKCVKCSIEIQQPLDQFEEVDLKKKLIVKGLFEIILGFFTCKLHMQKRDRHDAVRSLLNLSVFKSNQDIRVLYQLHLAGNTRIQREVEKLVHWDRKSQRLFIDGSFCCENHKAGAKFVNFFAVEIAEGLLPQESVTTVNELRDLIYMGFLHEFEEQSIQFLLTRENMEFLPEDEAFLASALSSNDGRHLSKRCVSAVQELAPSTPNASQHVKRRRLEEMEHECRLTSNVTPNVNKLSKTAAAEGEASEDTNMKPKRPKNSFVIFMEEFRKHNKLEHTPNKDIIASGSEKWRAMSSLEKAPFVELAKTKQAEYTKELETYQSNKQDASVKDKSQSNDSAEDEDEAME